MISGCCGFWFSCTWAEPLDLSESAAAWGTEPGVAGCPPGVAGCPPGVAGCPPGVDAEGDFKVSLVAAVLMASEIQIPIKDGIIFAGLEFLSFLLLLFRVGRGPGCPGVFPVVRGPGCPVGEVLEHGRVVVQESGLPGAGGSELTTQRALAAALQALL